MTERENETLHVQIGLEESRQQTIRVLLQSSSDGELVERESDRTLGQSPARRSAGGRVTVSILLNVVVFLV